MYAIIPQATTFPVDPFLTLSAEPCLPKSSSFIVMAIALPTMPLGPPASDRSGSLIVTFAVPLASATTLPRSPT